MSTRNIAQQAQALDLKRQEQINRQIESINRLLGIIQRTAFAVSQLADDAITSDARHELLAILGGTEDGTEDNAQPNDGQAAGRTDTADSVQVVDGAGRVIRTIYIPQEGSD